MHEHELCQVQIESLKDELLEFKRDVWDHLREVRESHKMYAETIAVLRENVVRLTSIAERQDEKLDEINGELRQWRSIEQREDDGDRQWYRQFIEDKEKVFVYVLLVLLAFSLGIRLDDVVSVWRGE